MVRVKEEVDREYLNNTGDTTCGWTKRFAQKSKEVRRLLALVERVSTALVHGYESMFERVGPHDP